MVRHTDGFFQGGGQVRLTISGMIKLVNNLFGKVFNTQTAGHLPAVMPAHAIRHRHQQPAIIDGYEDRLVIFGSHAAVQGKDQMIILIVATAAPHVGGVSNPRAEMEGSLDFADQGRYFRLAFRHEDNSSPPPMLWETIPLRNLVLQQFNENFGKCKP